MGRGTDLDWLETLQNGSKMKKSEHFQLPRIKVHFDCFILVIVIL
uniref:Uncharacterized protein n=1 Tax=Ascaris lumbricoides TaxID=6252 RepID=A0A0M3HMG8_ASCLU